MKKGIEVWPDYDRTGRWVLNIEKKRGKLTLEDIEAAAKEYEEDVYLLVINCLEVCDGVQFDEDPEGERVQLYRSDSLRRDYEDAAGI